MLAYFKGQVVEEVQSPYNGTIQVVKHWGKHKIVAGGLLQSGSIIKVLWQKPLRQVIKSRHHVARILILGLGGGTVAHQCAKHWPQATMTGVEIDCEMIRIGRQYFGLDKLKQLEVIETDAFTYVETPMSFDLILVDLFCGDQTSQKLQSKLFLKYLRKCLSKKGILIFNTLFWGEHQQRAEALVEVSEKEFKEIQLVRSLSNLFVISSA